MLKRSTINRNKLPYSSFIFVNPICQKHITARIYAFKLFSPFFKHDFFFLFCAIYRCILQNNVHSFKLYFNKTSSIVFDMANGNLW